MRHDVAIIGAGTAGCAAAAALAPHLGVALIDRDAVPRWRIGETLPGAAARLLRAIGAWEGFVAARHPQAPVRISRWGSDEPETLDSLRDPDGVGWRLNRSNFETNLREVASRRGAALVLGAGLAALERVGDAWRLTLTDGRWIRARYLIDASGRQSRLLRRAGQRQVALDRLACAYQLAEAASGEDDAAIYTHAAEDGWWYSAQIGDGRRLVAFHSDADLPVLKAVVRAGVLNTASGIPGLAAMLGGALPGARNPPAMCRASSIARSAAGPGWLAIGDAALAFDPLSSQGLFNALATGVEAAEALLVAEQQGETLHAWRGYATRIGQIWQAYLGHMRMVYALERRWPEAPFWARRTS